MKHIVTYRCDGCGTEYRILGDDQPTVLCPDCEQVATQYGDDAAKRAYRVGYATYIEARRQTTEAMTCFEEDQLALARGSFNDAAVEFEDSVEKFTTALTRADSERLADPAESARKKATCLWQAVEWLGGATYAVEQGETVRASEYKYDAEQRLHAATEYGSLSSPDELTPRPESERA